MWPFKKKTKVSFIKTTSLDFNGSWTTCYHSELDGVYVPNSQSPAQAKAEEFYLQLLKNKGLNKHKEVIQENEVSAI